MSKVHEGAAPQDVRLRQAHYALLVLWLAQLIANVDRFAFGVVMEKIKTDLVLTDAQISLANGLAFAMAYLGFGIPVSHWLGRANRRNVLAGAVGVWSLMTVACGSAANFVQLTVARIGLGAGEAPCVPAALSLINNYFGREKRTQAIGIFNSAAAAAGILGTTIMGYIADNYGWRNGFYAFGAIGLALALVVRFTLREPSRALPGSALEACVTDPLQQGFMASLRVIFGNRTFRGILLAHGLYGIGFWSYASWLGVLLVRSHGLNYTELGLYSGVLIGFTMLISSISSGYFSPKIVQRLRDDRWMVWIPAIACALSVPFMLLGSMDVPRDVVMVCGVGVFFLSLSRTPPLFSVSMDLLPPSTHASATMALVIFGSILGSALGPVLTGALSDAWAPTLGSGPALQHAMLWTAPVFCALGSVLAFLPARHMPRLLVPA
jgi:predicted MFS family arabinose efflux permease